MKTETVRTRSFLKILRKLPISAKLQFLVVFFVCIFVAMLGLVVASSEFTSGARAFVQGEGSWSKAQKQAAIELLDYAASRDEKDWQEFQKSLSVPLGDRIAREELERAKPDLARVEAGFLKGRNAKEDIPKMISLFRRLRNTREIDDALEAVQQLNVGVQS